MGNYCLRMSYSLLKEGVHFFNILHSRVLDSDLKLETQNQNHSKPTSSSPNMNARPNPALMQPKRSNRPGLGLVNLLGIVM